MTETTQVIVYDPSGNPDAVRLFEAADVLATKAEKFAGMLIQAQGDAEVMLEFRARTNAVATELDKVRLAAGDELRAKLAALNQAYNNKITALKAVVKKSDEQLLAWDAKQKAERERVLREQQETEERLAREREAAAAQAAEAAALADNATNEADRQAAQELAAEAQTKAAQIEQQQEVVAQALAPAPLAKSIRGTHGSSGGPRENWTWELIDTPEQPASESIKLVPEAYLLPPAERINRSVMTAFARSSKGKVSVPGIKIENKAIISSRVAR